jgi:alkanesulfonate monooxygenase SsuD/methylene tetrahydromethanopterin reductase-like flavin-dependent oxidoreductase (luciferase family)
MVDFGLHLFRPDAGLSLEQHAHQHLDGLPPAISTVWISDHLQQDLEPWPEAWTRSVWLATTFPELRVGQLVLSQSYRNPGLLASMAATLQELSGGRLILGLGAGWLEEEYRAFNWEYPSGGTRVAQLGEAIELMKALWTGEPVSYEGRWYRLDGAICLRPEPPIPVLVGTNGPKAIEVVARVADWWVWDGPWDVSYRVPFERLRAACEAIGRPFEAITKCTELAISFPDDPSTFEPTYEHVFYPGQTFGVVGPTPSDAIREIERLVDVGVSHVILSVERPADLRRFVDEVLPAFA